MEYNLRRMLFAALLCAIAALIVSYAYLKFSALLSGPSLTVTVALTSTTSPLATIAGTAVNAKSLTLAGRPIFIDLKGHFSEQLLLFPGYNIIELTAKDVRGKEVRKEIMLAYGTDGVRGQMEKEVRGE